MASKDNKFSRTEGGAMLTSNSSAQPSFNNNSLNLHRNNMPMGMPERNVAPDAKEENNQPSTNPDNELDNSQNASSPNDEQNGQADESQGNAKTLLGSNANKNLLSKAGKATKTVEKVKKIKTIISIISAVFSAIGAFLSMLISILIMILPYLPAIIAVAAIISFITGLFTVSDEKMTTQQYLAYMLPNREYIKSEADIKKISGIDAAIYATANYMANRVGDFKDYYYYYIANDVCKLSFAGLGIESSDIDEYCVDWKISNSCRVVDIKQVVCESSNYLINSEEYENTINDLIRTNAPNNEFNFETYKKYLISSKYISTKYSNELGADNENSDLIDEIISGIESDYNKFYPEFERALRDSYNSGSGDELTVVDTLYSIYGNSKCAILEEYNPITHEYVVSRGTESNEIHSVSDGEVVYVNDKGINLYDHYDYKSDKCLCNGIVCDNYDGSEIKIKFTYDDIEYMAIYSNLSEIKVKEGDTVSKGDVIALEGNTGCTSIKKLTFKLISENGVSYNSNELLQRCSTSSLTASACNFQNININLDTCDNKNEYISFYDYVKKETYRNFKSGINNPELLKVGVILTTTKILRENNYKIGMTNFNIKSCNYNNINISESDSLILDKIINEMFGQVLIYNNSFANIKYSNTCTRTDKDVNANSVYNELCINEALKFKDKTYEEILKIYFPNYSLSKNYCFDYASKINNYSLNNNKPYLNSFGNKIEKLNTNLKSRIELAGYGTRAGVVEAARFLTLGLDNKIPYKNGGKFFELGLNEDWNSDGLDSSGFVSWALLNGGANINKTMTIKELINTNTTGNLKITADLYKYYDKIQVGDFAYRDSKIGIIIGKDNGILYVAESNLEEGLIVTQITSYGNSSSNYSHIYFTDDYYNSVGNISSMW